MYEREIYVREKLQQLERERPGVPRPPRDQRPRKRLLAAVVRRAGHRIRHIGEALEAWAAPVPRDARG